MHAHALPCLIVNVMSPVVVAPSGFSHHHIVVFKIFSHYKHSFKHINIHVCRCLFLKANITAVCVRMAIDKTIEGVKSRIAIFCCQRIKSLVETLIFPEKLK